MRPAASPAGKPISGKSQSSGKPIIIWSFFGAAMATREQVYEEVGRALEAACILEMTLGTSLLTLDGLATRSYINPDADAYMRLRNAMEKKTLGQSLDAMKKQLLLPAGIE